MKPKFTQNGYAQPHQQKVITIQVDEGTTFLQAIEQRHVDFYPERVNSIKLGSFSRAMTSDVLKPGMRVEIYRPLIADPKEARRRRVEKPRAVAKIVNAKKCAYNVFLVSEQVYCVWQAFFGGILNSLLNS